MTYSAALNSALRILNTSFHFDNKPKAKKQSFYWPITGPEGSRRLRLTDFVTIGTRMW